MKKLIRRLMILLIVFGLCFLGYYVYAVSPKDYEFHEQNYINSQISSQLNGLKIAFLSDINLTNQEELIYYNYEEVMKQLGTEEFTKEQMLRYINTIDAFSLYGAFYLSSTIYLFSIYIIFTFSDVLLLSILGFFTARIAKMKLKYLPIINIAVYSITLSVLLNAIYMIINILTGFEIEYFRIMYNAIAYIYVVTAILMIRAEMIKQQIEFAKLIEEQKKVKEELEQKQREKEDEKEKQKEEKPKDKQKEKKDEKNENDGVADGSSAV